MQLGRLDVCLRVASAAASRVFYQGLGFDLVEGVEADGWAVVSNGVVRLGLFEAAFMDDDFVSLNFRGGHVGEIASSLGEKGYMFVSEPKIRPDGSGSARLRDPDGYLVFFDSSPGELSGEKAKS